MVSVWRDEGSCIEVAGHAVLLINPQSHPALQAFLSQYPNADEQRAQARIAITAQADGFHLLWREAPSASNRNRASSALDIHVDLQQVTSLRSFPAAKQGAFNQALGKKTKVIIDATGGFGGDALLMCSQGYQVHIIERNPVMALLLSEAMHRLGESEWAQTNAVAVPSVHLGESQHQLAELSKMLDADCVYLDPMFPAKRKKSAAANKKMTFLAHLVGADLDATDVLQSALQNGYRRVVVKRPSYAQELCSDSFFTKPSTQFVSKLVHYDVYFN